jgi:hypothetical protein
MWNAVGRLGKVCWKLNGAIVLETQKREDHFCLEPVFYTGKNRNGGEKIDGGSKLVQYLKKRTICEQLYGTITEDTIWRLHSTACTWAKSVQALVPVTSDI